MKNTGQTTTLIVAAARTMADVEAILPTLGYSTSSEANIRAAVRKCRKAYKESDLSRISADPDAFERKWGTGRVSFLAVGFKSRDQFIRWRKDVLAVLRRVGPKRARSTHALLPEWSDVVTLVRENQGRLRVFGANTDLTLGRLAKEASADNRLPNALDPGWIDRKSRSLRGEDRKKFKRGVLAMNRVIAHAAVLPEIAHLLPMEPLQEPTPLRDPASIWRRSAGHPAAAKLWCEFDEIIERKRFGEGGPQIKGEPADFDETSADAYGRALEWLTKGLALADALDVGDELGLSDVITHANLVIATNNWIDRREARSLSTEKSTLHAHLTKLVHVATTYLPVSDKERRRLIDLRRNKRVRTASVGRMSAGREAWIREFDASPAKQRAASRMPEELQKKSQRTLDRLRTSRPPSKTEVMSALHMGVAAMIAAVLFRASPIRAANLRHLRFRGENPDFRISDNRKMVQIVIPGSEVKNGEGIDDPSDDDLAPILEWYLREIRPRLITAHPFNRGFCDSDYLFPSTTAAPMERTMCATWYADGCEAAGVPMTLHQARHISAYWILKEDPNGWRDAAAVLHIDEMTVRKHYGWMSAQRANESGRAKLQTARKNVRKHRKGEFEHAA